jgi:hypothetical protein
MVAWTCWGPMAENNLELVRGLYGFNWVGIREREEGLRASAEVLAADVEARISPEVADRTLHGIGDFTIFIQSLEADFSEFVYDAEEFGEPTPGEVLVRGRIRVRGRSSKFPLTVPFRHLWTLRDGQAVKIEAHLGDDG